MDIQNNFFSLTQPLCVREALSGQVIYAAPEDRPVLQQLPDYSVFAVFETSHQLEIFLGLVTAEQVAAHPDRILVDLLPKPAPSPLEPDTPVAVAKRRLEVERVGALPVLGEDDRFVGAVTLLSLLEASLAREFQLSRDGRRLLARCREEHQRLVDHTSHLRDFQNASKQLLQTVVYTYAEREVVQHGIEMLRRLIGARYGAVALLDEKGDIEDFVYAGLGSEAADRIGRLPEGKGLLSIDVLGKTGTLRLENMAEHPGAVGFPQGHPPMRSLVAALIEHRGECYGRVYLCDRLDETPFSAEDEALVKEFATILAVAVKNSRERERQRENEMQLKIAAEVFNQSAEAILVTDADTRILMVNQTLTTITGYRSEELVGKTPQIFSSGHHDKAFYRRMWRSLHENGQWEGEIWNRRKNGSEYPEWLHISALTDDDGQVSHYVAVFSDLSRLSVRQEGMERLARFDHLTDLPNRLVFQAELRHAMLRTRFNGKYTALLMLDLDRFKTVNDTLGHQVGDQLLQQVAKRLRHCLRQRQAPRMGDVVARLSGDEFTIILNDLTSREDAETVARKIISRLQAPFVLGELKRSVTASIGIALYPDANTETLDDLITHADQAMYHAKQAGHNGYRFFDSQVHAQAKRRLMLENQLYNALDREEFELYYQPQVAAQNGHVIGLEALLRWRHPEHGLVSPGEFIPILEKTGLMIPVGEWILRTACAQYRDTVRALGAREGEVTMAVNLSVHQLTSRLPGLISALLEEYRLAPHWLKLELTESAAMGDPEGSMRIFGNLKKLGMEICIDDFGTGYSSLSYLRRLPIANLKIDRSFIADMTWDSEGRTIVNTLIALAHNLGLKVIAEGVETKAQYALLREYGCEVMQGFLFGRPVALSQLKPLCFAANPD
ncbi:EAL domain-containing protein [Methylohalobius crimeensis]|uniref:EAL domain-containing protein n=1 Tax=Methylohalobius crimeensis TaxID=244365 RepID=UPI0003B52932|nr:EAL domain-containing protein [Methylohalobius crimeensis]